VNVKLRIIDEVNGRKVFTPKPETEEYNVRSFIYSRQRPFHPRRLFALLHDKFILQMENEENEDEDEEDDDEEDSENDDEEMTDADKDEDAEMVIVEAEDADSVSSVAELPSSPASKSSASTVGTAACSHAGGDKMQSEHDLEIPSNEVILQNKRAHAVFGRLFRSKGEFFLATRPRRAGDWSQAGAMLTMTGGRPWFCTLPPEEYTTGDEQVDGLVRHDIAKGGEWGDRRQELVFIGERLDHEALERLLDACLLDDDEFERWQGVMRNHATADFEKLREALEDVFEDGFPYWGGDDGEEDDDHDHAGHSHGHPRPPRRKLEEVL
jgi:G3E family GTPase